MDSISLTFLGTACRTRPRLHFFATRVKNYYALESISSDEGGAGLLSSILSAGRIGIIKTWITQRLPGKEIISRLNNFELS